MRFQSVGLKHSSQKNLIRHRVLIADDDLPFSRQMSDYLKNYGFECRIASTISEAKELIEFWHPDSVFVDLMLPETNALSLCKFVRIRSLPKTPKIIVMSKQTLPQGIETMRRAGAAHYLVKPFGFEEVFRLIDIAPPLTEPPRPQEPPNPEATIRELHLLNLFLKQALVDDGAERISLFNLMRMIGLKVHAVRCSMIHCLNDDTGIVVASNDDENIRGLPLQLSAYPEVLEVRRTLKPLIIANVKASDLMTKVAAQVQHAGFVSMAVFPLSNRGKFYGVLSLRLEQRSKVEMYYVEKFGQVCSQIISLAIGTRAP